MEPWRASIPLIRSKHAIVSHMQEVVGIWKEVRGASGGFHAEEKSMIYRVLHVRSTWLNSNMIDVLSPSM